MSVRTIVLGLDGSPGAQQALDYALQEASEKRATLRVVSAWHVPTIVYAGGIAPPVDLDGFREGAEADAREAVTRASEEAKDVPVETVVREGQAAEVLLEASKDADLLIVGSRGLGGFSGLLLGSVSQQCAHHAHCPVVIVRGRERHD